MIEGTAVALPSGELLGEVGGGGRAVPVTWQPIETARKDQRLILWAQGRVTLGRWDDDRYAHTPRPYWRLIDEHIYGKVHGRAYPPTHWMPLPPPPAGEAAP